MHINIHSGILPGIMVYCRASCLALAVLVGGCASNIPQDIRKPPQNNPTLSMVRADPEPFSGTSVRWGGVIAGVQNWQSESWIEIVARDLDKSGRPKSSDYSAGRFIAVVNEFLDPAIFSEYREVTVSGVIKGAIEEKIGQHPYLYPRIEVQSYMLWKPLPPPTYGYPYWYDPWFGPGFGPYPYYHYRPYRYYY